MKVFIVNNSFDEIACVIWYLLGISSEGSTMCILKALLVLSFVQISLAVQFQMSSFFRNHKLMSGVDFAQPVSAHKKKIEKCYFTLQGERVY